MLSALCGSTAEKNMINGKILPVLCVTASLFAFGCASSKSNDAQPAPANPGYNTMAPAQQTPPPAPTEDVQKAPAKHHVKHHARHHKRHSQAARSSQSKQQTPKTDSQPAM